MTLHSFFRLVWASVLSGAIFLFSTSVIRAQVVINEVHSAPSTGNDWVELYNSGTTTVDLNGWKLEDQLTSPSTISSWSTSTPLPADSYLVVEVGNKLNNSGDGATLKNATGQIQDQMSYTGSTTDQSWARQPNATGPFVLAISSRGQLNPTPVPSPTPSPSPSPTPQPSPSSQPSPSPSPTPTPTTYPSQLVLTEIMACPEAGQEEWVELYNPDSTTYTLANWQFRDSSNNVRALNTTLPANGYIVVPFTSAWLNNDGDSLSLLRPDGLNLFTEQFGACVKGSSLIKVDDTWQNTTQITKAAPNPSTTPTNNPSASPTPEETNTLNLGEPTFFASQSASVTMGVNRTFPTNPLIVHEEIPTASMGALVLQTSPEPSPNATEASASPLSVRKIFPIGAIIAAAIGGVFLILASFSGGYLAFELRKSGFDWQALLAAAAENSLAHSSSFPNTPGNNSFS
jgi:hypothetical protein